MSANERMTGLKREKFDSLLQEQGYKFYNEFYPVWVERYNITTLRPKGFSALINNKVSWRLDYAMSFCHMLGVAVEDLFYFSYNSYDSAIQ